ncbi:MAG: rRNA maturation RNase YbeY [Lachnospira sp.]
MTINIDYDTDKVLNLDYENIIKSVVTASLEQEGCPYETEINVVLTDNESIHEINKEYRDVDSETDVLSFPMIEYETPSDFEGLKDTLDLDSEDYFNPDSGELVLGDIVISVEKVMEQSDKYGHSPKRELAFLVAHSMMHLCGYDHMVPDEEKVMIEKQNQVLDTLGINR